MKKHPLILALLVIFCLASCEKKINASSEESLAFTSKEIYNSLNKKDAEEFELALDSVIDHYYFELESEEQLKKVLHNKSAKQVIKLAKNLDKNNSSGKKPWE